jgi:uncharacterized protein YndB with AHSA1/START domain
LSAVRQAEHTVTIGRSAEDVFDYLADGSNNPRWRPGVVEIRRTSDTAEGGATYRQVLRGPGGRKIAGDYRVTTYDRPGRLDFQVTAGPARPCGTFELTPDGPARTTVTFRLTVKPTGITRVFTPMIARQMQIETRQLDNLKDRLESKS